jgi:hypothetical protein
MLSPYFAWFSMPVPVQHQNESLGVPNTRWLPDRNGM